MHGRKPGPDRETIAKIEIGHTTVSRSLACLLTGMFLLVVCAVPVMQSAYERQTSADGKPGPRFSHSPDSGTSSLAARFRANRRSMRVGGQGPVALMIALNRALLEGISTFEHYLDDASLLGRVVRPPMQYVLTRWLGVGNEQAYHGRPPWIFYRSGIDALTGPGFLGAAQLDRRAATGNEWTASLQPDPRPAILRFHRQLAARGITLILMPTPDKSTIHPERFAGRAGDWTEPVHNPSYARLLRELERAGVPVVDVSHELVEAKRRLGGDQYLATDTHWRPEAVQLAAARLKAAIESHASLPPSPPAGYRIRQQEIANLGDVASMLSLPPWQRLYRQERVTIRQVETAGGDLWRPVASADLLVLGDSFSNVYSLPAMGWGEAAGLVEHLSYLMQRPIDRLIRNNDGAFATRDLLARELARGRDRLRGKQSVVWQFAARELAVGDWKLIDVTLEHPSAARFVTPASGEEWLVRGLVQAVAPVPRPGTVPYKDHVVAIHLVDLDANRPPLQGGQALVYMLSMRDNVWTPAARYRPGDTIEIRMRNWGDVAGTYEGINRTELDDEELRLEPPCWGEVVR